MRTAIVFALVLIASPALAGPQCTDEPESLWLTESEMKERIGTMGYSIDVFKKTNGNCYEIYGRDGAGKRIEIYFNPVTGEIVKSSSP